MADGMRVLHFVVEGEGEGEPVDVDALGAQFAPDVLLVSVNPGEEKRAAGYAAGLGAAVVVPHHHQAYGGLPDADLGVFAQELSHLAPDSTLLTPGLLEPIDLGR